MSCENVSKNINSILSILIIKTTIFTNPNLVFELYLLKLFHTYYYALYISIVY